MLYVGFRCNIVNVMVTGVGGNAAVEKGHAAVCGCRNGCMCLVWVLRGGGCISRYMAGVVVVYVAGEWVQVLVEKTWYLPRCCGCGPKEPVCSLVHCV